MIGNPSHSFGSRAPVGDVEGLPELLDKASASLPLGSARAEGIVARLRRDGPKVTLASSTR